jgi:hypothetical protein
MHKLSIVVGFAASRDFDFYPFVRKTACFRFAKNSRRQYSVLHHHQPNEELTNTTRMEKGTVSLNLATSCPTPILHTWLQSSAVVGYKVPVLLFTIALSDS